MPDKHSDLKHFYEKELLPRLTPDAVFGPGLKRVGEQLRGPCPLHGGDGPNFAVDPITLNWFCHSACQKGGDAIQFMNGGRTARGKEFLRALRKLAAIVGIEVPEKRREEAKASPSKSATYVYGDEDGAWFEVRRSIGPDGKKQFRQFRYETAGPNAGKAIPGLYRKTGDGKRALAVPIIPYRLLDVYRARDSGQPVFVCEGEKDVDNVRNILGLAASCNPGGAGKHWEKIAQYFKGTRVVIMPDNDEAGIKGAKKAALALQNESVDVRVLELPGLRRGGDVSDWIQSGGTREDLTRLEEEATPASEWLKTKPSKDRPRTDALPTVVCSGGSLSNDVRIAAGVLSEKPLAFSHGMRVVRVLVEDMASADAGIERPPGAVLIRPVNSDAAVFILGELARWFREKDDELVPIDCPKPVAKSLIAVGGELLPRLRGVTETPLLRNDGSVITKPGFDPGSSLFLHLDPNDWELLNHRPSRTDAKEAIERILSIFSDFPFVEEFDRSAMLAAVLTVVTRKSYDTAPLFAFSATTPGTGKTLIADCLAVIGTGRRGVMMPQGRDEDEDRKRIFSSLLAGDSVIVIDNVERTMSSSALCAALTAASYKDRVLGASQVVEVSTATTWITTGNNLEIAGDLIRRTVPCRLDAKCERPDQRSGPEVGQDFAISDLVRYVATNRARIITDSLTALRGYILAGRPQVVRPFGSFEEWSRAVRSTIVWCGYADPIEGRKALEELDSRRLAFSALLATWVGHPALASKWTSARELMDIHSGALGDHDLALKEAIIEFCGQENPSAQQLGTRLRRHAGRVIDSLRLESRPDLHGKKKMWRVARIAGSAGSCG